MANEKATVTKDTKKMKFERILPLVEHDEVLYAFVQSEISALERKAEKATSAPTKDQLLMNQLMDIVEGAMTALDEAETVSVILHLPEVEAFGADKEKFPVGLSQQRMTSCLHKMVTAGKVKKVEGKTNKFILA